MQGWVSQVETTSHLFIDDGDDAEMVTCCERVSESVVLAMVPCSRGAAWMPGGRAL